MPSLNHIHKYRRLNKQQYQCADPMCTHFIDKNLLKGKASRCNQCNAEIILTPTLLQRTEPKCINCSQTKAAKEYREQKKILEGLGIQ